MPNRRDIALDLPVKLANLALEALRAVRVFLAPRPDRVERPLSRVPQHVRRHVAPNPLEHLAVESSTEGRKLFEQTVGPRFARPEHRYCLTRTRLSPDPLKLELATMLLPHSPQRTMPLSR